MTANQHISKAYLAWLTAMILFLGTGLFLYIQKLETFGTELLGAVSFSGLAGIATFLILIALGSFYKSLKSELLKPKYRWAEGAMLVVCLTLVFLLEMIARQGWGISTIVPFIDPSGSSTWFLLLALICALISKKFSTA
jgi:hypothetical protein